MVVVRTAKPVAEMTVPELIERFESDIVYDAHSFALKYGRSEARRELLNRGPDTIKEIVEHLWDGKGNRWQELRRAWGNLLDEFARAPTRKSAGSIMGG